MVTAVLKKIFVDTQYVAALINRRDQFHARAMELADELDGQPLLTTDSVLIEIGNALARRCRREAVEVIERFLGSEEVEIIRTTPELLLEALSLYRTHDDKSWGMTDCVSFVVMRQWGVDDALTHDQHFVQAGFSALMRTTL
jgi:hypothetical protein